MRHASGSGAVFSVCCGRGCGQDCFRRPGAVGFAEGRVSKIGVSLSAEEGLSWDEQRRDTTGCRRNSRTGTSSHCIADIAVPICCLARHRRASKRVASPFVCNQGRPAKFVPSGPPTSICAQSNPGGNAHPTLGIPAQDRPEAATLAVHSVGSGRLAPSSRKAAGQH